MLRILHIVPAMPFGGLQRLAVSLAAEQRRCGVDAEILSIYDGEEIEGLLRSTQVPFISSGGERPSPASLRRTFQSIRRDWDILHVHAGLLWCNALALFCKDMPVVFHAHNYPPTSTSLRATTLKRVNRWLINSIFAVSEDVARAWRNGGVSAPVHCVYNGISIPPAPPRVRSRVADRPITFGMATRLASDKGLREFVEAACAIHTLLPSTEFAIAGTGPEEKTLRDHIAASGLTDVFKMCGYVKNVDEFWDGLDVALFTAPTEPFGLRILEAMRQGVPVVAYLTGAGSDEIFRPGVTAVAVPLGDAALLAAAAVDLVRDEVASQRMVAAAFRDLQARFSVRAMTERISELYLQIR